MDSIMDVYDLYIYITIYIPAAWHTGGAAVAHQHDGDLGIRRPGVPMPHGCRKRRIAQRGWVWCPTLLKAR